MTTRDIVDLIRLLKPNLVWAKYQFVLEQINQVKNELEQAKLIQFFNQKSLNKSLHQIKYSVDGGQNVTDILTRMKQDGF